jgi:hypothetical protein
MPRTPEQEKERADRVRVLKLRWWVADNFPRACQNPANPAESPFADEVGPVTALQVREHKVRRWFNDGIAPHTDDLEKVARWIMVRLLEAPPGEDLPAELAELRKRRRR